MALKPGPMQVVHDFFTTKSEVLRDIDRLDLWPTTYVSERMQELPLHWHDVDNCGYVLSGSSYVIDETGERIPLGPGDKLVIPAGAAPVDHRPAGPHRGAGAVSGSCTRPCRSLGGHPAADRGRLRRRGAGTGMNGAGGDMDSTSRRTESP